MAASDAESPIEMSRAILMIGNISTREAQTAQYIRHYQTILASLLPKTGRRRLHCASSSIASHEAKKDASCTPKMRRWRVQHPLVWSATELYTVTL